MTIAFKELAGSPTETFAPEGMKAQRRILVAWKDRHAMVGELLGNGFEFGTRGPAQYPNRNAVVAMRVKLEPWPQCPEDQGAFADIALDVNSYSGKFATIVIDYELLDTSGGRPDAPNIENETFLTYRMDFGGECIEIPSQSMQWYGASGVPVPPEAVPTVRVPVVEHHITWHRVINPPWTTIHNSVGTVNSAAFMGSPAETVLLDGVTADKEFVNIDSLNAPQFGWRIRYVFREKAIKSGGNVYGWNHAYRSLPADDPGWSKLVDQASEGLYRTSEFTPLFQFAATT
jgi:hypothetical protein